MRIDIYTNHNNYVHSCVYTKAAHEAHELLINELIVLFYIYVQKVTGLSLAKITRRQLMERRN